MSAVSNSVRSQYNSISIFLDILFSALAVFVLLALVAELVCHDNYLNVTVNEAIARFEWNKVSCGLKS